MSEPKRLYLAAQVEHLKELAQKATVQPTPPPNVEVLEFPPDPAMEELHRQNQWRQWTEIVPRRFVHSKPSDFIHEAEKTRQQLTEWCKQPEGRNLLFVGPVGTGKTHAAVAAAGVRFFVHGSWVKFWPVVELLDALRPGGASEDDDVMEVAMRCALLVLDDLGAEKPTEWTAERLYAIVNRRWMDERPIIATSNLPATQKTAPKGYEGETLDEAVGPRMFSRLVGSGAVIVRLSGPDRRR